MNVGQTHRFQYLLRTYYNEPLKYILVRRLRLPLPLIGFLFAFMYFGVLLILHEVTGHASPSTLEDVLRVPSASSYYYPNVVAIVYDLIGNPLLLLMLIFFGLYIPQQIEQLEQSKLIQPISSSPKLIHRLVNRGASSRLLAQILLIFPLVVAAGATALGVILWPPTDTPGNYAVFLSFLGHYGQIAVFVQLTLLLLILNSYTLTPGLHLRHPDGCSGLAPFGRLGLVAYLYLFVLALKGAIGTIAGGTPLQQLIEQTVKSSAWIYSWVFFPIACFFIFDQLLYKPHCALRDLQRRYLLKAGTEWNRYHQRLSTSIIRSVEESQDLLSDRLELQFDDDLKLLEIWDKLNQDVGHMNIWPIPLRTLRVIAFFANPLIPILLPFIVETITNIIP